jgi:putative DNA primase/helicase
MPDAGEPKTVDLPVVTDLDKTGESGSPAHSGIAPESIPVIDIPKVGSKPTGEILARAGISKLTGQSSIDEVEASLRQLRKEMSGADRLREMAVRSEAIKHLQSIGLQAPAQLVSAALTQQNQQQGETRNISFHEPEPWPQPVDGSLLLDGIADSLRRFVILPTAEIAAITLWIIHTYAVEATAICPILIIKSAEKRCGKTLILELLLNLVFRPLPVSNITASSLFRVIERYKPTLLLDEADTFLGDNDELRGVLNSGYRRSSSYVIRTVGENFEPVVFNTFGPKAVAQINMPRETIVDRGVIIEMRRKAPGERTERLRSDRIFKEFHPLRQKITRWAKDNLRQLTDYEPQVPESLNDRAQDSWRPLLAIAELAGERWTGYGRASAVKLSEGKSEVSRRTLLLADIRDIFRQLGTGRMASADICTRLGIMEEHPWPEWRDGRPITVRQLARMLEPLDIRPKQLRMGDVNIRGYELTDFADSFARYLPDFPPDR